MGAILGSWLAAHGVELVIAVIGVVFTKQKAGEPRKAWLKNVGTGVWHAVEDMALKDPKLKGSKAAKGYELMKQRLTDGGKKPLTEEETNYLADLWWSLSHQQKTAAPATPAPPKPGPLPLPHAA